MRERKLTWQEKVAKHHLQKLYRIILCVVLIVLLIVSVRIYKDNKVFKEYETLKTYEAVGSSESTVKIYNNDNILCYSRDGISAYNAKGEQIWNQTYEMQSPIVDTNGEYVVAGDFKGRNIYIMNGAGPCATIECNKILVDLKVSEGGIVIATLDDSNITWVELYSSDGTNVATIKTSMDQTGFPLNISMANDNRKMAVTYLKAKGSGMITSLAFYNFGDVGQNVSDKIVSGYDFVETVIPYIHFMDESNAVAIGESSFYVFSGKQIPELKKEAAIDKEIVSAFYGQGYTALIFHNEESEDRYLMELYNLNAEKVFSKTFNMEYDDVMICNNQIVIYNEAEVQIWNLKGLEKYNGDLGVDIKALIPTKSATKFMVVRDGSLELIKLK